MMTFLFILLFVNIVFIWFGKRHIAIYSFLVTFALSSLWLVHHITDALPIQL